jgi:endonuclease YncB( thermonuclease family)
MAGFLASGPTSVASATTTALDKDSTARELLGPFSALQQFDTVSDIPAEFFANRRSIYAFVERVTDGDTIRVRHYPGFSIFNQPVEPLKGKLSDKTIKVRLYGVDTPELAKNKNQSSQPFAEEAKEFTKKLLFHQKVVVTFLGKDQYGRAIAQVQTIPVSTLGGTLPPKDASVELVGAGRFCFLLLALFHCSANRCSRCMHKVLLKYIAEKALSILA